MGQYFYLVNVDRQQANYLGKLGEAVYENLGLFQYLTRVPSSDTIGSWAGHRLITIGDYMGECPAGMLTKAEEDEIADEDSYYNFVADNYHSYRPDGHGTAPDGHVLILRNLSKQVYVREQDFLHYQRDKGVKAEHVWGFDQLILINTAWSDDPSCNMADPGFDIIPGPWAGDRFDITVLESIDRELWQDVTKQEAKKMTEIVKAETSRKTESARDGRTLFAISLLT
ncbi:hypothetical protein M378DRAFT_6227 [Amanita muscaria Koide BX008]|uniref:Uncharacterized protein n=1 Tax=Amanita muscaria (strain Koide BX008) TaxID=946122 RepID=A0A0C2TVW7_AMAMK|nr:hypothetical protein M378DRAFT_6227 [Amanita muscaria Koide BX008]